MRIITKMLAQRGVYWSPIGKNEYGQKTYGDPVAIRCRWEDMNEQFVDPSGTQRVSKARVYVDRDVEVQGVLWLSDLAKAATDEEVLAELDDEENPFGNDGAWEVKSFNKMPTLKATKFLRYAML